MTIPLTEIQSHTEHQVAAEGLLQELVAIASPSHKEQEAVRYLVDWFSANGYTKAFVDDVGNAVGVIGEGDGTCDIVLLGHIDTFTGHPPTVLDERILYGRGSVDAKGSLCTFSVAGSQLVDQLPVGVRIIVIGAVEEEAASSAGARYVATQYAPRYCVIGEPSQWDRITLGYKGRLLIEWEWTGGFTHSASDHPTAAERAYAYWQRVQEYVQTINADQNTIFGRLDASIRDVNTGTQDDGTSEWGRMTIGFRLPPSLTPDEVANALPAGKNETLRVYGRENPFTAEKDSLLTRALRGSIRAGGGTPRFVYKTGTSDMNVVGRRWKCPIVAYGPGDSALDHTPHEHIHLDEYLRAIEVLSAALRRLCEEL